MITTYYSTKEWAKLSTERKLGFAKVTRTADGRWAAVSFNF